ncbi:MAG: phosphate ABC transporter permease subunit PstC [Bacteroidota bacterium]
MRSRRADGVTGKRIITAPVETTGDGEAILPVAAPSLSVSGRRWNPGDFVFKHLTLFFSLVLLSLVFLMGYEMYRGSAITLEKFGWEFLTTSTWDPVMDEYGALPFIYGTVVSSLVALLIALPLGLGVAIFLAELSPAWLERPLSFLVELLAAIPSIVYGLWGIFVLVPWLRLNVQPLLSTHLGFLPLFKGPAYGFGMLAAGLILAVMVLPIIASISRDVLRAVPNTQREAALALGGTRWETTKIVLGTAKSGILGATLLGLGRAVGETMAVTMVIGNRADISASLFNPAYSMASVIANEFAEATTPAYTSALIEIALVLFVVTIILNAAARLIVWGVTRKFRTA